MPVDPAILRKAETSAISTDKPCHSCGYNLIGLKPGDPCPECGTHIPIKRVGVKGDNLADAPIQFLRQFAWSVLATAATLAATIVTTAAARGLASRSLAAIALVAGLALVGATWLVTRQRALTERTVKDEILDSPKWRLATRLAVCAWPVYAVAIFVHLAAVAGSWSAAGVTGFATGLFGFAAALALIPLFIQFSIYAAWAGDTSLQSRLRGCVWIILVGSALIVATTLLAMIVPRPLVGATQLAGFFITIFYIGAIVVAVIGALQLASVAFAAIASNKAITDRDARIAARRAAEMSDTVDRQFSAPVPVDPYNPMIESQHQPADQPRPTIGRLQRIERAGDTEAYDLAPDDDEPLPQP